MTTAKTQAGCCQLHFMAMLALAAMPLLLGCLPAPASTPSVTASGSISTDPFSERSVDLGRLGSDDLPTHIFKLKNSTDRSILITAVEKSCGCQTVGLREGASIPAGSSLDVSYALPADRFGPIGGRLTIRTDSDSTDLAAVRFSLSATMPQRVWADPGTLRLSRGTFETATVVIRADIPEILERYTHVDTARGHVAVDQIETVCRSDGSLERLILQVHMASTIPAGLVNDYLSVHFDDERAPQIDLLVQADGSLPQASSSPSPSPNNGESAP